MQVHNIEFHIADGPDRYRVAFDRYEKVKGKKWTVYVSCNGALSSQKEYYTNATPTQIVARWFARLYSK